MAFNRPWRDIVDLPHMEWPDWEKRFAATDGDVRTAASTQPAPPPEEKIIKHRWNRTERSNDIGLVPKKKA